MPNGFATQGFDFLQSFDFVQVCGGRVLDLFHSRELMALVAGTENYNWKELEESAKYKVNLTIISFQTIFLMEDSEKVKALKAIIQ